MSGIRFLQVKRDPQENPQALYQIADAQYDGFQFLVQLAAQAKKNRTATSAPRT